MPRMRGRLYSSCASSTWSLPSALRACWAKMSRISCVRSTTRALSASSSAPLLARVELVVDEQRLGARLGEGVLQLLELALADVGARVGRGAVLDELADGLDAGRARQLAELGQLLAVSAPLGSTATTNPRSGSAPGAGSGWRWVTAGLSTRQCRADRAAASVTTGGRPEGRPLASASRSVYWWRSTGDGDEPVAGDAVEDVLSGLARAEEHRESCCLRLTG